MEGTGAMHCNCLSMRLGRISLMLKKPIVRVLNMGFGHQPVPSHLGNDRGSSDGGAFRLSLDQGELRKGDRNLGTAIDKEIVRSRAIIGGCTCGQCPAHS